MIGSPDVLAFSGAEGFGEGEEEQEAAGLPEELSVPLLPVGRPWSSAARFNRDFILVAEFSEQVGPKPVLTIPDDQRVIGSFDLNHFSVRIMSVDYQASGPGHAPPSSHGPQLNFSEDSRVILGDSAEDAFAYVQHLTLYDLEARGMVRPFCMAYVCSDQDKLMENFSELSACFSQASDSLKTGNRQAFSMELQRKLQELESRRLILRQETEDRSTVEEFTEAEEKVDELEAVERSIFNHRDLLRQVTSYPNRKLKQPDFLPYDPADSLTDPPSLLSPEPFFSSSSLSSSYKADHRLKSLQELSNSYFLSLMKEQLADTERRLRGDRSILRTARIAHSLSRRLTLTNFLFELWSPEEEEEEEEKDGREAELQTTAGRKQAVPPEGFRSEPPVLESFFSCVEELPIKLEAGEAGSTDPCAEAEMTGSVSSGDSIEVLGTEKSYRTQQAVAANDIRETPVAVTDAYIRRPAADLGFRRVRTYAKRANSEDSIEVLSTTESIFPDDLTAITEEEAEHQALSNGFQAAEELRGDGRSDPGSGERKTSNEAYSFYKGEDEEAVEEVQGCVDEVKSSEEAADNNTGVTVKDALVLATQEPKENSPERTPRVLQVEEALESISSPELQKKMRSIPDLLVNFAPPLPLTEADQWSPPRTLLRLLSVDEASDCASFTSSSDPSSSSSSSNQSVSGYIHSERIRRRRKAGLRALRFIKHNSFSQHAVYCLLSGRPLVVIGGDESLVRKLVDALSLFLPAPGPDGGAVMPCLTTPLQLTDLLTWRLIGIHRSPSSSSSTILHSLTRYSRYLALLDLDQRTLQSPSYSGSLLGRLADPQCAISRGITYLLHLESCLTALANQVLLYTFKPASKPQDVAGRGSSPAEGEEAKEDPRSAGGRCSSHSDGRVMHFLSDLIKQRHAGRGPPILRFSYCSVLLHRNTFVT